jgi:hypothetical protein
MLATRLVSADLFDALAAYRLILFSHCCNPLGRLDQLHATAKYAAHHSQTADPCDFPGSIKSSRSYYFSLVSTTALDLWRKRPPQAGLRCKSLVSWSHLARVADETRIKVIHISAACLATVTPRRRTSPSCQQRTWTGHRRSDCSRRTALWHTCLSRATERLVR